MTGVLGIFFLVSSFRAVSCLTNQFLTALEVGFSRKGVRHCGQGVLAAYSLCISLPALFHKAPAMAEVPNIT